MLNATDKDAVEREREACWARFLAAANAAIEGDHEPARAYIASVEARFGAIVAERSRRELWNYVRPRTVAVPARSDAP